MAAEDWSTLSKAILKSGREELIELIDYTRSITAYPLLKNTQLRPITWSRQDSNLAQIEILADDDHLTKSRDKTMEEELREGPGDWVRGLMLQLKLDRAMQAPYRLFPAGIEVTLQLSPGPETNAFRDIYRNWRGLVEILTEDRALRATIMQSNLGVPSVQNRTLLTVLDVALDLRYAQQEIYFQFESNWKEGTPAETIIRSFQALAIIFTCIQQAAHAPPTRCLEQARQRQKIIHD